MTEIAVDFLFWAGVFATVSPLIVSLLKNVGREWSLRAKQATAAVMAVIGSVFAYAVSMGLDSVALDDFAGFWQPLVIGVVGIFAAQYASYMAIWDDTKVEKALAKVGTKS